MGVIINYSLLVIPVVPLDAAVGRKFLPSDNRPKYQKVTIRPQMAVRPICKKRQFVHIV